MFLVTRQKRRTRLRHLILPVLALGAGSYFTYHAFEGDYGIRSKEKMAERIVELKAELASIAVEREQLAWRVQLLQDGSLERDMIDERARHTLGAVRLDEVVILR